MTQTKSKPAVLPRSFYNRSPEVVARSCSANSSTHRREGERLTGRIIEAEAYLGLSDPASHTFTGLSSYNAVLFGPPGHADVYLIYGRYYCLNVSCLPDGEPGEFCFALSSRPKVSKRWQDSTASDPLHRPSY